MTYWFWIWNCFLHLSKFIPYFQDFPDDNSSDKWDSSNIAVKSEILFCHEEGKSSSSEKKSDSNRVIRISQYPKPKKHAEPIPSSNKENIASNVIPNVPNETSGVPVKKKRGRKPGSKGKPKQAPGFLKCGSKNYFSPTLKNPEKHPELLYYNDDDDDDGIFLRHTSKDVMLSITLPFQESLEFRELRASYVRQCEMKMDIFRDYKSMFQNI